nr:nectin-4-like [Lytechinus pictus]
MQSEESGSGDIIEMTSADREEALENKLASESAELTNLSSQMSRFMDVVSMNNAFRLHTEESLTAVLGRNISLPCTFSIHALAVYWYKHDFTGAPDDGASLVARDYRGITDPVPGFERFSITNDYSLIIRNITVHDETTYSCLVVDIEKERGYTELRVIALAEPLEPIVESCNVTAQGRCIYIVGENSPEDVTPVCLVHNVRPPPGLTWVRSDGRVLENATQQMQEKDGLFNISSQIQVTKADFGKQYTCEANGDAVNGTSSMKITIIEGDVTTVSHDRGISGGLITSIVIIVILLILLVSCLIYYKKCGVPGPLGDSITLLLETSILNLRTMFLFASNSISNH